MSVETHQADFPGAENAPRRTVLRQGLGRTLLIWFVLLPVTSLLIAGIIITGITHQNARQATIDRLSAIATLKQSEINAWVAAQQNELELIVNTPKVRSELLYVLTAKTQDALLDATRDQLQQYVSVITSRGGTFEELFLLDASGKVLLSNNQLQVGTFHTQQAYFAKGQEGPYIDPPNYSFYTAAPSIVLAQPVKDDDGRLLGVLAGRLSLRRAEAIMKEEAGLGRTGETYLVNAAGLILTPPRLGQDVTLGQELHTEGVKHGLALSQSANQEEMGWNIYGNYQGRRVLGVYRWIPDLQVVLLAEQEMGEAMALTRGFLITNLAILLVVAIVAASTALLVSRRIVGPVEALTASANQLAAGELAYEVPHTERGDEIGALARAFSQMRQQLRDLIGSLEEQVARRTSQWQDANYKFQRRAIQLEAVTLVGRAATSILNLDDLLLEVVNLIRSRFDFYHAGIFLLDNNGEWAVLRQASGEAGQRMLARKHRLAVGGQSIVGWVTAHRQPRIALDVGADAVHFKNLDLPHTHSEMALPLVVGDRLLGVLDVQSIEEAAFDEDDVTVLSLMADQLAVAIDNALKFSDEAAILEATSPLYRASRRIALATSLDEVLKGLVEHATGSHMDRCSISLYAGPEGQAPLWLEVGALWDRASDPPDPLGTRYPLEQFETLARLRLEGQPPIALSNLSGDVPVDELDVHTRSLLVDHQQVRAILMLSLISEGQPVGVLSIASRQPHTWTQPEVHTFKSLSDQIAVAIKNVRLFEEARVRARREQIIRQVTEEMWHAVDVDSILQTTVTKLGSAIGAPRVHAWLGAEIERRPGNGSSQISSTPGSESSGQVRNPRNERDQIKEDQV